MTLIPDFYLKILIDTNLFLHFYSLKNYLSDLIYFAQHYSGKLLGLSKFKSFIQNFEHSFAVNFCQKCFKVEKGQSSGVNPKGTFPKNLYLPMALQ